MKTWQSNTEVTNIWGIQVEMWHKIRLLKENNGTFQTFKKKNTIMELGNQESYF